MKSLTLTDNKTLIYGDTPTPVPQQNDVLVDIKAAALNHRDVWIWHGLYAGIKYPVILGSDGAGICEGREVIINPSIHWGNNQNYQGDDYQILGLPADGTFSGQVVVNRQQIFNKPPHLDFHQAAALPLAGLTAYRALFTKGKINRHKKVLIAGIGGGVALFALQFAIATGADVFVTSGSDEKIATAIAMGAKGGVNYKNVTWEKEMSTISSGIDLFIDGAAGEGIGKYAKIANKGARIVIYGGTRGKINGLIPQIVFWKQLKILGSTMGSPKEFAEMLDFVNKNRIFPKIDSIFALKDGQAAFEKMNKGQQFGKIVLNT